jgi:hypothetical protein
MKVICSHRDKCKETECEHYNVHEHNSTLTTCHKGYCIHVKYPIVNKVRCKEYKEPLLTEKDMII